MLISDNYNSLAEVHTEEEDAAKSLVPETDKPTEKSIVVSKEFRTLKNIIASSYLLEFLEKGTNLSET